MVKKKASLKLRPIKLYLKEASKAFLAILGERSGGRIDREVFDATLNIRNKLVSGEAPDKDNSF